MPWRWGWALGLPEIQCPMPRRGSSILNLWASRLWHYGSLGTQMLNVNSIHPNLQQSEFIVVVLLPSRARCTRAKGCSPTGV